MNGKQLSSAPVSRKKKNNLSPSQWDAWLAERQIQERHTSLLRRLDGLVQDAQNERLDKAAAVLRTTAEIFRSALSEEKLKRNRGSRV